MGGAAGPAMAGAASAGRGSVLLRLAVWELTNTKTDPRIVIDEAVELAQDYSTAKRGFC